MPDNTSDIQRAMATADSRPDDVESQISAAWACDRLGDESDAIRYYDRAWALGVPVERRQQFMVGYGSTLRNVGRLDEAILIHREAISESPDYVPNQAFLALALNAAGANDQALAVALTALVDSSPDLLDGYDRALSAYRDELLKGR